jgi:hypothetical protein
MPYIYRHLLHRSNEMNELKKVETLVKNTVMLYQKYAEAATESEKAYYEGALEASTNIYDYILSITAVQDTHGTSSK